MPSALELKAEEINLVLSEPDVDLWQLRALALSEGGLVNDVLRKQAWPKLVGLHDLYEDNSTTRTSNSASPDAQPQTPTKEASRTTSTPYNLRPRNRPPPSPARPVTASAPTTPPSPFASRDAEQIQRDCQRCTWHLLTGTQRAQRLQMEHKRNKKMVKLIHRKQGRLGNLINYTLVESYNVTDPEDADNAAKLHYYQGFHDVACIFLSTLGGATTPRVAAAGAPPVVPGGPSLASLDLPCAVLLQVSQSHFADCMRPNFSCLQTAMRLVLFPLIAVSDADVHEHLYQAQMEPFFCLSWILTWFAHDIRDTDTVKRLFDVFMVSHPLMPLYLSVAMVVHPVNRDELLETEVGDFAVLHNTLAGLPKNSSMVGWKYRPGDGYVSDDEQDDDGTLSTGAMSVDDADFLMVERHHGGRNGLFGDDANNANEAHSLVSTAMSSLEPPAKVPFQELIDNALTLMRKYPPRKLMNLATRYYGKEQMQVLKQEADPDTIRMMQDPPAWSCVGTVKADWVLKQRARERKGLPSRNRRDRRREQKRARSRSRGASLTRVPSGDSAETSKVKSTTSSNADNVQRYLVDQKNTAAVIALGFGSADDVERRRRKQRKLTIAGVVAVAVVAIVIGVVLQNREQVPLLDAASNRPNRAPTGASDKQNGGTAAVSKASSVWGDNSVPQTVVCREQTFDSPVSPATSVQLGSGQVIQQDVDQLGDWVKGAVAGTWKRVACGLIRVGSHVEGASQGVVKNRHLHAFIQGAAGIFKDSPAGQTCKRLLDTPPVQEIGKVLQAVSQNVVRALHDASVQGHYNSRV